MIEAKAHLSEIATTLKQNIKNCIWEVYKIQENNDD